MINAVFLIVVPGAGEHVHAAGGNDNGHPSTTTRCARIYPTIPSYPSDDECTWAEETALYSVSYAAPTSMVGMSRPHRRSLFVPLLYTVGSGGAAKDFVINYYTD